MRKSFLRTTACAALALLFAGMAIGGEAIKWQVQTSEVAGTARYTCAEKFVDLVREKTGGRLRIELFSSDTLYPTMNVIETVTFGMNPAALTSGDYLAGKEVLLKLDAFRPTDPWNKRFDLDMELYKRTEDLVRKAYDNNGVYFVGSTMSMPGETFHSTVPINKLSDLKGLRVRSAGLGQELYESFGAAVTLMPMGDVYTAIKLGTIHAAEIGGFVDNYAQALYEVVKYNIEPAPHTSAGFNAGQFIVNKEVWATVPEDIKAILRECVYESRDWSWHYLDEQNEKYQKLFEDAGTVTIYLPEEETAAAKRNAAEFTRKYWGKSALLDQYFEIYIKFLEEKGFKEVADKLKK